MEVLIDAKIDKALAGYSASQLQAKLHAINNRVKTMLSPLTPLNSRITESIGALRTCEEIYKLFEDRIYVFSENKLKSSPHLVSFSSNYLVVANLVHKLRPEFREALVEDMGKLTELNKVYMKEAIKQGTLQEKLIEIRSKFTAHT